MKASWSKLVHTDRSLILCLSLLCSSYASTLAHGDSETTPSISAPNVTAVPSTADSQPFLASARRLHDAGYVEEEYFLSGQAHVYDWSGAEGHQVEIIAGPASYVNRILVRRPRDAARFSGNVEVLVLNASTGRDLGGPIDFERMTAQGDVWIGVTSKAVSVNALKEFDRERYAALDWSTPLEPAQRCDDPSIIPMYMAGEGWLVRLMDALGMVRSSYTESEDGLIWDMLAQLGWLLKSGQRERILPGFAEPTLYMVGASQSSIYMRTWLAAFHSTLRLPDGGPIYDGYLALVGPAMARIHQCAEDVPLRDPRQILDPPDVPFVSLYSEGELWQGMHTRRVDAFTAQGGFVTYEVAGASHVSGALPASRTASTEAESRADGPGRGSMLGLMARWMRGGDDPNDFIWSPIIRGAHRNLQAWVRQGIRPPQAPVIELDSNGQIVRDRFGNAVGGVRMPYIEVPTATHRGYLSAGGLGGIMGTKKPFARDVLSSLYPDHAAYVASFDRAVDRLLTERWILPADAEAMRAAAADSQVP